MQFILHREFTQLEPLAAEWNALLAESVTHVPFLRHEYLRTWWETRGGGEWPESDLAVVVARHEDGRMGHQAREYDRSISHRRPRKA